LPGAITVLTPIPKSLIEAIIHMHVAVDVGGTFTDLVVAYEDGSVVGYKTPSTRPDIIKGFFDGLKLIAERESVNLDELMQRIKRIDFGTTVATNALLEGKAARTGLIITRGFRDTLLVREGGKSDSYNMKAVYPEPYIARSLTKEVIERVTAEGDILTPLDEASVHAAVAELKKQKVDAVVVSLIWAIANPQHELRVAEILRAEMPDIAISLGHQVNPCVREYRRTIAAAIDASLKPLVAHNIQLMESRLKQYKFGGKLSYIVSTGGKASATDVLKRPVYLCYSGPSAAPESGKRFALMEGFADGNVLTVDMGGTSFDVSIVTAGKLPMHREGVIAGHMFGVPSVEIHAIGAGGGSIARVDDGGFLHVGPESAGSEPGPASYQRGGTRAAVTDANLVVGYLSDEFSAGGGMKLSLELAEEAISNNVARRLGLTTVASAALIVHACEQSMVAAIEDITIRRGVDPREYVLVAGGAAAGAHAVSIAREIGISQVIIPKMAGVLSAYGILAGEIRFGYARSLFTSSENFNQSGVLAIIEQLRAQAREFLESMSVPAVNQILEFTCEARYAGQVWQLTLPFEPEDITAPEVAIRLKDGFDKLHASLYSAHSASDVVEFTEWNVQARGQLAEVTLPDISKTASPSLAKSSRKVYFKDVKKTIDVPVYGPLSLPIEQDIQGPLLIDESLTTIVIDPGAKVRLSRFGNYVVRL
jgi:N-methylhydantoinase A